VFEGVGLICGCCPASARPRRAGASSAEPGGGRASGAAGAALIYKQLNSATRVDAATPNVTPVFPSGLWRCQPEGCTRQNQPSATPNASTRTRSLTRGAARHIPPSGHPGGMRSCNHPNRRSPHRRRSARSPSSTTSNPKPEANHYLSRHSRPRASGVRTISQGIGQIVTDETVEQPSLEAGSSRD